MSSSIPSMGVNFGPIQSRKRGLTRTLLGSEYEEIVTSIVKPPQPLKNLSDYTAERVREGLKYADSTLRHPERKISPGGAIALNLYKETCVGLLDILDIDEGEIFETTPEKRKAIEDSHRAFIREAEKGIQMNACMQATKTNSAQELQDEILSLQRTAFYARYRDYFAEICRDLKVASERSKLDGWRTLSKSYWSDIADEVEAESPVYKRFQKGERGLNEEMPTTHAILVAAYAIGLHPDDTLQIVKQYGIRNNLLHANLLPMVKGGLFMGLAERICRDRTDIPLLVPASQNAESRVLEGLLDSMIDLWFTKDELDPLNYQMWTVKPELRNRYKELNASSPVENQAQINQSISKEITKAFKKNLRESNSEDELLALFEKVTGKKRPPKRVASSQLKEERERLVVMKKKWAAIENSISHSKSLYDAYVLSGRREIGRPGEIVEDYDL